MIKERIIELIEYKGLAKENFYQDIGVTSANFRGKSKKRPLNSNAIENILSVVPDVNSEWLLTGKGSMLKNEQNKPPPDPGPAIEKEKLELENAQLKEKISLQLEIIELLRDKLALYEEKYKPGKEKKAG